MIDNEVNSKSLWQVYSCAPHRMMFSGGAVQLVLTILFWSVELAGRHTAMSYEMALSIPVTWAHAYLMLFGIFPFFTFGFLMTTYPKWMNGKPVPASSYVPSFFLLTAGTLLFYAGLFSIKAVLIAGVIFHVFGWALGYHALLRVYMAVRGADRYHAGHLNAALAFGITGEFVFLTFLSTGSFFLYEMALNFALWLYIVPMLVTVAHRMLPFFSGNVIENYVLYRPRWYLYIFWTCMSWIVLFSLIGNPYAQVIFQIIVLLSTLFLTFKWGFFRSFKNRLLAVLHVSFLWISIAMFLYIIQTLYLFVTDELILGKAPLHAIAIGFVTSMIIAMGTRVSLGHSGRELVMDTFSWICFWGVQLAALLRILSELESANNLVPIDLNLMASFVWLLFIIPWAVKYGLIYLRPRIDGQPG